MNFFSEHMTEALAAALNRSEQTSLAGGGEGGKRTRPLTSSRPERRGVLRLGHHEGSPFIDTRIGNPKAARLLPCLAALSRSARPPNRIRCVSVTIRDGTAQGAFPISNLTWQDRHNMGRVIRGFEILCTSSHERYDSLFYNDYRDPDLEYSENNPLGVSAGLIGK